MSAVELAPRIVADPEILGGKPLVAGSRITVEFLLGQLGRGVDIDALCRDYDLDRDDVLAALRFAAAAVGRDSYATPAR